MILRYTKNTESGIEVFCIDTKTGLTQTLTQMRISADRTGKDSMRELRAKLRRQKKF